MKKVILISLMVAGMVSAVFASESLDAESAAMDQTLFDSVAGEELSEVDMLAVEGEGYRNAIAYASYAGGSMAVSLFLTYLMKHPVHPLEAALLVGVAGTIGWLHGFDISDSQNPDYRAMGLGFLDNEPWNTWVPIID